MPQANPIFIIRIALCCRLSQRQIYDQFWN
jgi:hypothetical protein